MQQVAPQNLPTIQTNRSLSKLPSNMPSLWTLPNSSEVVTFIADKAKVPAMYVEMVADAKEHPIRCEENSDALTKFLSLEIDYCIVAFTGAQAKRAELTEECLQLIFSKYEHLGKDEIREAFRMCVRKELDVNLATYYGQFTAVAFGEVMYAYNQHRMNVNAAIVNALHDEERKAKERIVADVKNEQAYEYAANEIGEIIRATLEKTGEDPTKIFEDFVTPYNLPVDVVEILTSDRNVAKLEIPLDRKRELWGDAYGRALSEIAMLKTSMVTDDRILYRAIVQSNFNHPKFKDTRVKIYSRLVVHEHIKTRYYEVLSDGF